MTLPRQKMALSMSINLLGLILDDRHREKLFILDVDLVKTYLAQCCLPLS